MTNNMPIHPAPSPPTADESWRALLKHCRGCQPCALFLLNQGPVCPTFDAMCAEREVIGRFMGFWREVIKTVSEL